MTAYPALKALHVTCVAASYALFFTRGVWMARQPAMLQRRWVKIVPHIVDTVLLASAIALAVMVFFYIVAVALTRNPLPWSGFGP